MYYKHSWHIRFQQDSVKLASASQPPIKRLSRLPSPWYHSADDLNAVDRAHMSVGHSVARVLSSFLLRYDTGCHKMFTRHDVVLHECSF